MNFINVIKEGDFVKLKSLQSIILDGKYLLSKTCPIIGGECLVNPKNKEDFFIIEPNTLEELGNVVRIKQVFSNSGIIYFKAENNGIVYHYEDGEDLNFDDRLIESVFLNGKWYDANERLNTILN